MREPNLQLRQALALCVYSFLILLITLSSCTSSSKSYRDGPDAESANIANFDLDKIRKRGYITVIMDNSSTGFFIYRGRTMGYEYDLMRLFAESEGLELRIKVIKDMKEAFEELNKGNGDVLAYNLTITKDRKKRIAFTHYHNLVKMVLVQRKPAAWREMKLHEIEKELIRNPIDLIGEEVVVRYHSAYLSRLQHLSDEIGGDIIIIEGDPEEETEAIIKKVAQGELNYTVVDEDIAMVNAAYYPNLDVRTAVSFPTQIAWGVRKNADSLLLALNEWILEMRQTSDYYTIYDKYFKSRRSSLRRTRSDFFSSEGGSLSPFDSLIERYAKELDWDWRLLAAQVYQESKFDPEAESWAGAIGLLQLLPTTAAAHGVTELKDPEQNLYAGVAHLKWLQDYFADQVEDPDERRKFVLAAYNVGHGHVMDAIRLTSKYGGDENVWEGQVEKYLLKKSEKQFYNDPVVQFGYCRGSEPVAYVGDICDIFNSYKALYPDSSTE